MWFSTKIDNKKNEIDVSPHAVAGQGEEDMSSPDEAVLRGRLKNVACLQNPV